LFELGGQLVMIKANFFDFGLLQFEELLLLFEFGLQLSFVEISLV
jgi:hypothetical protein